MIKTNRGRSTKLTVSNLLRTVKSGDQLQRYDYDKQEWYLSYTIATNQDIERAFDILRTENQSARIIRPAVIIASGAWS